jgi:chromosome segregation ATPase
MSEQPQLTSRENGLIALTREIIETKLDERDRRYDERDKRYEERDRRYDQQFKSAEVAVNAALAAQQKLTDAAFAASEKAITKAEEAQKSYNQTHNDLSRKLDEQNKATMPRQEVESRFNSEAERLEEVKNKVAELEKYRSSLLGKDTAQERGQATTALWIGVAISVVLGLASLIVQLAKLHQ